MAVLLSILSAITAQPELTHAQLPTGGFRGGIGYTLTLPESFLGGGAFYMFGSSGVWGLYTDAQTKAGSVRGEPEFLHGMTVQSVEATPIPPGYSIVESQRFHEWLTLNVGVVRAMTPSLATVVAGGGARRRAYREYLDQDNVFQSPVFVVEDPTISGWRPNVSLGAILTTGNRVAVLTAYQSAPKSLSLGLFFTFP